MTLLFVGGLMASRVYDVDVTVSRRSAPDGDSTYVPRYAREGGQQILMVYVGSSSCVWSNEAPLPAAVEAIKMQLAEYAAERGWSFKAVGVALDWSPELGLEHLAQFGRFDEVSAGYNWGNTLALGYLWSDPSAKVATPQVLVYRRVLHVPRDSSDVLRYEERDRQLLMSRVGAPAITDWVKVGTLLAEDG